MSDRMSPYNVLAAINRLEDELPALVGVDGWSQIGAELEQTIARLCSTCDPAEQEDLADRLIDLLDGYEQAKARFTAEIAIQAAVKDDLARELTAIAARLGAEVTGNAKASAEASMEAAYYAVSWAFDPTDLPASEMARITTIQPGLQRGKSIKFSNIRVNLGKINELGAGAMLAGYNAIDNAHPLVIAAAVLLTINAMLKAITVELTADEASVFWGFIQARDMDNTAPEGTIFERTNAERQRYGLDALTEAKFGNALAALEQLKCIEKLESSPDYWRIVENYRIQS